jgi:hypothetical protein
MGLDMSLYKRPLSEKMRMLWKLDGRDEHIDLMYWRKLYILNDFIIQNYYKGDGDGNCEDIPLTEGNILDIIDFLEKLKETDFEPYYSTDNRDDDVKKLKEIIDDTDFDNEEVYYHAWW